MSRRKYLEPNWHSVSYDSFAWKLVPIEPTDHMLDLGACFEDPSDYYGPLMDEGDLSRDVYRAMLEAAPEPPKGLWFPIETAPMDWTDVLLFDADYPNDFRKVFQGYYDTDLGKWMSCSIGIYALCPSHWMPLPAPPIAMGE